MAAGDLDRIARAYGVRLLLQFGSSVTGKAHPRSDVDLGVLASREIWRERRAAKGEAGELQEIVAPEVHGDDHYIEAPSRARSLLYRKVGIG